MATKSPLPPDLLAFARNLRIEATDAEELVWHLLRNRAFLGHKFRRQHPVPPYVLDFYCHERKLAIELDGGQHGEDGARAADARRTRFLEGRGIRILRFWNHDVLARTEEVLEAVYQALEQGGPSTAVPSPGAPSPGAARHPLPEVEGTNGNPLPPGEGQG